MNFYHFIPAATLQALMRGESTGYIPTLCPTSNLVGHGLLTLYCQYGPPVAWRLSQQDPLDPPYTGDPGNLDCLKVNFEGRGRRPNQFTLALLTQKERVRFLRDRELPKDASIVLTLPKEQARLKSKRNKPLTGATFVLVMDGLATVLQNNLMQVINANHPRNAELYPDARSKLEPARNIHRYTAIYLRGYQKQLVSKDSHATVVNLMMPTTLEDIRREQIFVLTLKTITNLLGSLVDFYQKNQVPKELEETITCEVLALSTDKLKYSCL